MGWGGGGGGGGGIHFITLLGGIFSTSLQSGNGHERNGLLCYSHPTGLVSMCHHYETGCFVTVRCGRLPPPPHPVFMYLYGESRRCSVLTPDKCFIQMLLSHIVEEVMNSHRLAAAGLVHGGGAERGAGTPPQQQN